MNKDAGSLRRKFYEVWPLLDERSRRLVAASEARSLGYGGVSKISRACGLSRKAVAKGMREISDGTTLADEPCRKLSSNAQSIRACKLAS